MLRPGAEEQKRRDEPPPVLLVLPGSRRGEIRHHMAVFGAALGRLSGRAWPSNGAADHAAFAEAVAAALKAWPVQPRVVVGETGQARGVPDRPRGTRQIRHRDARARAAGVPMAAAYRIGAIEASILRRAIKVSR